MLLGEVVLNIMFDLGGVVVTWEPEVLIAHVFADPAVQALVRTEIFGHADWLALDRVTLLRQDAIGRAVQRTGLSEADVAALLQQVPPALVASLIRRRVAEIKPRTHSACEPVRA